MSDRTSDPLAWRRLRNKDGEEHFYNPPESNRVVEGAWRLRDRYSSQTLGWKIGAVIFVNYEWQSLSMIGLRPINGGMAPDHECNEPEYWRPQTDVPEAI